VKPIRHRRKTGWRIGFLNEQKLRIDRSSVTIFIRAEKFIELSIRAKYSKAATG
jgi:hypothetical protein